MSYQYNNNNNYHGGGGGGGGGRRRFQRGRGGGRHRQQEPQITHEQRVAGLVVRVGDKAERLADNLTALTNALVQDLRTHRKLIRDTLLECVCELPFKTPVYASLVGLLNVRDPSFGAELVEHAGTTLSDMLEELANARRRPLEDSNAVRAKATRLRRRTRLLARFVGCLASCGVLRADDAIEWLDALLTTAIGAQFGGSTETKRAKDGDDNVDDDEDDKAAVEEDNQSEPQISRQARFVRRADFYASLVCDTLAWCGAKLFKEKSVAFGELWLKLELFFEKRPLAVPAPAPALRAVLPADNDNGGATNNNNNGGVQGHRDALNVRWERLCNQRNERGWAMAARIEELDELEAQFHGAVSPNFCAHFRLPRLSIDQGAFYSPPTPIFELLSEEERCNGLSFGEVAVVQEYVRDVLDAFNADHRGAAKFLRMLPLPRGVQERGADLLVLETIFGELLALPQSTFPVPFYAAVVGTLCASAPESVPRAFGKVALRIYKRADRIDVGTSDRFVRYLALHLSNFEFTWAWPQWAKTRDMPADDAKRLLCDEVIRACARLSYVQHVAEKLPEPLRDALPPDASSPQLIASADAAGTALFEALHRKDSSGAVAAQLAAAYGAHGLKTLVDESAPGAAELDFDTPLDAQAAQRRIEAFFEALLKAGQQSFSHFQSVLERYEAIARRLGVGGGTARRQIVATVARVWQLHPQLHVIAIDHLQKYAIIDATAIIGWAFDIDHLDHFQLAHVRDIVRKAIGWSVKAAIALSKRSKKSSKAVDEDNDEDKNNNNDHNDDDDDANEEEDDDDDDVDEDHDNDDNNNNNNSNNADDGHKRTKQSKAALKAQEALQNALVLLLECAARALPTARSSASTKHFMIGTVRDIVRLHSTEFGGVRSRINAIEDVDQLELSPAFDLEGCA